MRRASEQPEWVEELLALLRKRARQSMESTSSLTRYHALRSLDDLLGPPGAAA